VILFEAQLADTPAGSPRGVPIPVAPVVVCDIGVIAIPTQTDGVDEGTLTVLFAVTDIVPVAFTVPQPPVRVTV
jgi:hypothetical protein